MPAAGLGARTDERGNIVLEDLGERCRVAVPARYWEFVAQQVDAQAGPAGCAPRAAAAPGLLLQMADRDALAGVGLQKLPERFLARGPADLESYMETGLEQLRSQLGRSGSFENARWEERDGMKIYRCEFVRGDGQSAGAKMLLVRYFVRPEGEDAMVYQLVAMAAQEDFPWQQQDFEAVVESFRFTGKPAAAFYAPDAPEDKLPSARPPAAGGACGRQGLVGMAPAIIIVLAAYYLFVIRRRRKQQA